MIDVIRGVTVNVSIAQDPKNVGVRKELENGLRKLEAGAVAGAKETAAQRTKIDEQRLTHNAKIETQSLIEREQRAKKAAETEIKEAERIMQAKIRAGTQWAREIDKQQAESANAQLRYGATVAKEYDKRIKDREVTEKKAISAVEKAGEQMAKERERTADSFHRAELSRHGDRERRAQGSGSMMFGGLAGVARGGLEFAAGHQLANGGLDLKGFASKIAQVEGAYHMLASSDLVQGLRSTRMGQGIEAVGMRGANRLGRGLLHGLGTTAGAVGGGSSAAAAGVVVAEMATVAAAIAFGGKLLQESFASAAMDIHGNYKNRPLTNTLASTGGGIADWALENSGGALSGLARMTGSARQKNIDLNAKTARIAAALAKSQQDRADAEAISDAGLDSVNASRRIDIEAMRRYSGMHPTSPRQAFEYRISDATKHTERFLANAFDTTTPFTARDRAGEFAEGMSQAGVAIGQIKGQGQLQRSDAMGARGFFNAEKGARAAHATGARQALEAAGGSGPGERARAQALIQLWDANQNVDAMAPADLALVEQYGGEKRARGIRKAKHDTAAAAFPDMAKDEARAKAGPATDAGKFMNAIGIQSTGTKAIGSYSATFAVIVKSEQDEDAMIKKVEALMKDAFAKQAVERKTDALNNQGKEGTTRAAA